MPRQAGPHYIIGLHNGLIYYKTKFGYFFRRYTKPSKATLARPSNLRTRINNGRFGAASKAAALIKDAFAGPLEHAGSDDLVKRLIKAIKEGLSKDPTLSEVPPEITRADLDVLRHFQWHEEQQVSFSTGTNCNVSLNRETGEFDVFIKSLYTENLKQRHDRSTHFRIKAALTAINFKEKQCVTIHDETPLLGCKRQMTGDFVLSGKLPFIPEGSLFLLGIGVQGYDIVNRKARPFYASAGFTLVEV